MKTITSRSTRKKAIVVALIVATLIVAALLIVRQKSIQAAEKPPSPVPVAVEARQLVLARFALTLPLVADVQAVKEANIASRLTGYVAELRFSEGDSFKKGDILVRLDKADAESQVQRVGARLKVTSCAR